MGVEFGTQVALGALTVVVIIYIFKQTATLCSIKKLNKKKNHPLMAEHLPEVVIYREKWQMEFQVVHDSRC